MKIIYEKFIELAREFTDGHSMTHTSSKHSAKYCIAWQLGVREFAKWLDKNGYKIVEKL